MSIIYTCTCYKCKKLKPTTDLNRLVDTIVCEKCFQDALLIATPAEFYQLQAIKETLKNEPVVIEK